jgi:hypothetical protein
MEDSKGKFLNCVIVVHDTDASRQRKVPNIRGENRGKGKERAYGDTPLYHEK